MHIAKTTSKSKFADPSTATPGPRSMRVPTYGLHKASGQARVLLNGKHVYLGPYGSDESKQRYARLLAERFLDPSRNGGGDGQDEEGSCGAPPDDLTIEELIARYVLYTESYYVKDGRPARETLNIRLALRPVRALYADTAAAEFGPRKLKRVRDHMVQVEDLSRGVVNARVNKIRAMFKWAVSEELAPPQVLEALRAVDGLRRGKADARETEPVPPVADADVNATLPFLPPPIAAMVRLQRLTGMRPGSVIIMRLCDIDRSEDVWIYRPSEHKTKSRGGKLLIPLGPKAQAILTPYLERDDKAFLFNPVEVLAWHYEQRSQRSPRKTPVYPNELRRREREKRETARRRRRRSGKCVGDRYKTGSYRKAVTDGIERAIAAGVQVNRWFPNQLRHSRATEIRQQAGIEAARVSLGHAHAQVTEIYAERDLALAMEIARDTG